jgi:glycosyltransferase involved in cell wall biosynthesis
MTSVQPTQPILSICVPTYNRARYLECLLQNLSDQIGKLGFAYELLIGDNCSQDSTPALVAQFTPLLNIVYFRHPQNLGAYENLNHLIQSARGRYTIYLADDDLLILEVVHDLVQVMEANPGIGVAFAPWFIHDRIAHQDLMQFYTLESDTVISQGDHKNLFTLLVNRHLFPEIYIARTELRKSINLPVCPSAFIFFTQVAVMVDRTSVLFAQRPFYRSVSRYFEGEVRSQAGIEEVKVGWDRYRGGLEYILSRFSNRLTVQDLAKCRAAIDRFTAIRMGVGLRLRTASNQSWMDNYYLAARLRSTGFENLLPAPYDHYRVNAALEHLLNLKPFLPQNTNYAYLANDPPLSLMNARGFVKASFQVLKDANQSVKENTVLVTTTWNKPETLGLIVVHESDLLALFP